MFKIKDKEKVLKEYVKRYPELDQFVIDELSREYDRYIDLLKNLETRSEAISVFEEEIEKNERRYKENNMMKALEGSTHDQFMEILANYGMIVFFRDNMIE
ncbi:hypothetical protein [Tissierella praeacuta]|uniref:hypothetical protein n=1 Tax=Tissierella praeacuta TaxID=43131 RepID=UPI0033408D8F